MVEAVEKLCEEQGTLRDVVEVGRAAGFPMRSNVWPTPWALLADHLADADALVGVRGVARTTHFDWENRELPARVNRPDFVAVQCRIIREVFGNPFRATSFDPGWRTDTAVLLARQMYESREFSAMPILADALQDAGCDDDEALSHCRDAGATHLRGCWVVDLVLGKV